MSCFDPWSACDRGRSEKKVCTVSVVMYDSLDCLNIPSGLDLMNCVGNGVFLFCSTVDG